MALLQYPQQQCFIVIPTDTETRIADTCSFPTSLQHISLKILQVGTIATPYQMRLHFYNISDTSAAAKAIGFVPTKLLSSEWITIGAATLSPTYSDSWLGEVYFNFNGEFLSTGGKITLETSGYTQVGTTFYLAVNCDWPFAINNEGVESAAPAIAFIGRE